MSKQNRRASGAPKNGQPAAPTGAATGQIIVGIGASAGGLEALRSFRR